MECSDELLQAIVPRVPVKMVAQIFGDCLQKFLVNFIVKFGVNSLLGVLGLHSCDEDLEGRWVVRRLDEHAEGPEQSLAVSLERCRVDVVTAESLERLASLRVVLEQMMPEVNGEVETMRSLSEGFVPLTPHLDLGQRTTLVTIV